MATGLKYRSPEVWPQQGVFGVGSQGSNIDEIRLPLSIN